MLIISFAMHLMWCNELEQKIILRYFVTFYFWISLKHLKLCPNKLWSVKGVLYTRMKCGVWIQVQIIKIGTSKLKSELNSNTKNFFHKSWNSVFEFIFGEFIKMNFSNKVASTIVSLTGTKFVLTNGGIGW